MTTSTVIALPKPTREMPKRPRNAELRSREFLFPEEVAAMITAARRTGRYGIRDATLILVCYRHALRVTELVRLRWEQVDLNAATVFIKRVKSSRDGTHPVRGDELRALRQLRREWPQTPYVFATERGGPMTAMTARHIIKRAGRLAQLPFPVHPHMVRHATGYRLANKGIDTRTIQDYLGHANIQNTVIYTQLAATKFNDLWED
jgi:integrase